MRRAVIALTVGSLVLVGAGGAIAGVSDGNYNYHRHHCSGRAESYDTPQRVEPECNSTTVVLADHSGHEYVMVGIPHTPEGTAANALRFCIDMGQGSKTCALIDASGVHNPVTKPGTPAKPETGMHVYVGADDNLFNGEHDGSEDINNGPSDGGAVQVNATPDSLLKWLAEAQGGNTAYLLTHPSPGVDAGIGFCADGICISIQTQRRTAYQGGNRRAPARSASNYDGKKWDPETCSGPSDEKPDCDRSMRDWHNDSGTVYTEPGIQIYEDPDPQGSPIGPYPIPAFYIGTCGLVVGGGPVAAPPSPLTNSAGQLVVKTGC